MGNADVNPFIQLSDGCLYLDVTQMQQTHLAQNRSHTILQFLEVISHQIPGLYSSNLTQHPQSSLFLLQAIITFSTWTIAVVSYMSLLSHSFSFLEFIPHTSTKLIVRKRTVIMLFPLIKTEDYFFICFSEKLEFLSGAGRVLRD